MLYKISLFTFIFGSLVSMLAIVFLLLNPSSTCAEVMLFVGTGAVVCSTLEYFAYFMAWRDVEHK